MYCPNCGNKVDDGARFCNRCGTQLPVPTPEPRVYDKGILRGWLRFLPGIAAFAAALVVTLLFLPHILGHGVVPAAEPGSSETAVVAPPEEPPAINGTQVATIERPYLLSTLDLAGETLPGTWSGARTNTSTTNASSAGALTPQGAINYGDFQYLDPTLLAMIEENGFAINASWGSDEFFEVYESNSYQQTPSFVTTDAMMHTYHLYFMHLLKTTERTQLRPELLALCRAMLATSEVQYDRLLGTEWEDAAARNVAFFGVAATLLDPSTTVPAYAQDMVAQEVAGINAASGIGTSAITGDFEDYTQYIVRGYYEGDPALESYFRAMMWCGRINYKQSDETLDRCAALMTLALQGDALRSWESIYAITSFFAGASDDCGYYEYRPIIDAVWGEGATVEDLIGGQAGWEAYHAATAQMPAPQINSVVVYDEGEGVDHLEQEKGFRFMGQRFSIDAAVFQQLIYNKVGEDASGAKRMLPDALDVPAALGSDAALSILEGRGATAYAGYSDNMAALRAKLAAAGPELWQASLYSQWLYTIDPLLVPKGEGYPAFMQTDAWTRKSLQTYLGSYTELKHDTVLYSKQVIAEMGGDLIEDKDDRGYVEPEPELFRRLAALSRATAEGLAGYGMLGTADAENLERLASLADQLAVIADKELAGELPTDEEFELIRSFGGQLEHFWIEVYKDEAQGDYLRSEEFPAPVVTDVATNADGGTVLQLATGKASPIYVLVEVDGVPRIAVGSVFTFYQFEQPMAERLTDSRWREEMLPNATPEDWTDDFQFKQPYQY